MIFSSWFVMSFLTGVAFSLLPLFERELRDFTRRSSFPKDDGFYPNISGTQQPSKIPTFHKFCQNKKCMTVDIKRVLEFFPNILVPISDKEKVPGQIPEKAPESRPRPPVNSDEDACCPTLRGFDSSKTRVNTQGQIRIIFTLPTMRQLIPIGSCSNSGSCGNCKLNTRTMSILVVSFNPSHLLPVEFDKFAIPLYCTCLGPSSMGIR